MAYLIQFPGVPNLKTFADVNNYLKQLQIAMSAQGNVITNHTHKGVLNDFKLVTTIGFSGTITLAKLTSGGTQGSMTIINGIVTAYIAST